MTIKRIAELAGVSSAAVSRYLNNGSLSEEKRQRIRKAIEETGYEPNPVGQMLRTGRARQVGVILPTIYSESAALITAGISQRLAREGYMLILGDCAKDIDQEIRYLRAMESGRMAGIIVLASALPAELEKAFEKCSIPVVITGQNFPFMNCVYHDDFGAAKELAGRMIARGKRNIAYLGVGESDKAVGLQRRLGVQAALEEAGLAAGKMPRCLCDFSSESGMEGMETLFSQSPNLDGVIAATDVIALGAMVTIRKRGLRIPEDIVVAGFGDNWAGRIADPPLTSVRFQQKKCGEDAASLLLELLENETDQPVRQIRLGYEIMSRRSI